MSASPTVLDARRPWLDARSAGVACAGFGLLLARPHLAQAGAAGLPLSYATLIGATALPVPWVAVEGRRPLPMAAVLAIGLAALAAIAAVSPRPLPLRAIGPAALGLNTLAAVAEEAFFRRFLYGRLLRFGPAVAVGIGAVLFALVHLPAYGAAVLPVDLGAGLLLGWQRWAAGTWTVPAATHVVANLMAVIP